MERALTIRGHIKPGYKAFNGYIFTEYDCLNYNRVQDRINSFITSGFGAPEWLLNESHRTFCIITNQRTTA